MRILIADKQPIVRSAIRLLLEEQQMVDVIGEAANAQELLDLFNDYCPDTLLLEWDLPGLTPEKLLARVRNSYPDLFVIVLDSKPQIKQAALRAGANKFVSKNDPPECLLAAINSSNKRVKFSFG